MKNIHVLPTEKYSDLVYSTNKYGGYFLSKYYSPMKDMGDSYQNIYITSDEKFKKRDYGLIENEVGKITLTEDGYEFLIGKGVSYAYGDFYSLQKVCKKIILTTDQDLIKDGIQAIDDEFLEWFVKNPSCEEIFVKRVANGIANHKLTYRYKIIIPKEESKQDLEKEMFELEEQLDIPSHLRWHNSKPKQKTLEDLCDKVSFVNPRERVAYYNGLRNGAKWQAEINYSEEEVIILLQKYRYDLSSGKTSNLGDTTPNWFEQFKKKV